MRWRRAGPAPAIPQTGGRGLSSEEEELSAEEVKRRLDETRERLKRETAPSDEA